MPFQCANCPYATVPPTNLKLENNGSTHLLVFQAPGQAEWVNKRPLSSTSSHSCAVRMKNSFNRKNTSRSNYDIAEAVCCYPGLQKNGRDKKPCVSAIKCCTKNMESLLKKRHYTQISCFGELAYKVVSDAISNIKFSTGVWNGPTPQKITHPCGGLSNSGLDASY